MRRVLVFVMCVVATACTFPDVDYAEGGAGAADGGDTTSSSSSSSSSGTVTTSTSSSSGTTGTCPVSVDCATEAMTCAGTANGAHDLCVQKCAGNQPCIKGCDKTLQSALGACAAACDSCAADMMCKTNNCRALVGL